MLFKGHIIGRNKGFTLIELLVVIAIIGILAGIVLASLGNARSKSKDATIQEQLSSIRTAAEIYYGSNGNAYGAAGTSNGTAGANCATAGSVMWNDSSSNMKSLIAATNSAAGGIANTDCGSSASAWSVAATLPSGSGYWCVDSTGVSRGTLANGTAYGTGLVNAAGPHSTAGQTSCN